MGGVKIRKRNFLQSIVFIKSVLLLISACSLERTKNYNHYCKKLELDCIKENRLIILKTTKGDLEVELFGKDYPVTVANFIENIKNNIYRNQSFYKILKYPKVKIIKSGINLKNNDYSQKKKISRNIRPSIPLEIKFKKDNKTKYKYLTRETSELQEMKYYFQKGVLAMVKIEEKKSSSTDFFFVTNEIPELDGRYSIFGKIVKGFDVLEKINQDDLIKTIKISN